MSDFEYPKRTELTVLAADDPNKKQIGWQCYELTGTDVYRIPDGQEPSLELVKPNHLLTREDDLKAGMHLLIHDLFGWCHGIIQDDGRTCVSSTGQTLFCLQFVNDRPALPDGTEAPPRWVCIGSANLAGLRKLEVTR